MTRVDDVLGFWLDETGAEGWYKASDALDAEIRDRFLDDWKGARDGSFGLWLTHSSGALAYVILLDQFPRNMFRSGPEAFSTDPIALAAAKMAIGRDWDLGIDPPARQFFYLPLMHSENLSDQDRCVRLMKTRLADQPGNLLHARAHREVIRRFGRFPHRNDALGRTTTRTEAQFLDEGGYGAVVRKLEASAG